MAYLRFPLGGIKGRLKYPAVGTERVFYGIAGLGALSSSAADWLSGAISRIHKFYAATGARADTPSGAAFTGMKDQLLGFAQALAQTIDEGDEARAQVIAFDNRYAMGIFTSARGLAGDENWKIIDAIRSVQDHFESGVALAGEVVETRRIESLPPEQRQPHRILSFDDEEEAAPASPSKIEALRRAATAGAAAAFVRGGQATARPDRIASPPPERPPALTTQEQDRYLALAMQRSQAQAQAQVPTAVWAGIAMVAGISVLAIVLGRR